MYDCLPNPLSLTPLFLLSSRYWECACRRRLWEKHPSARQFQRLDENGILRSIHDVVEKWEGDKIVGYQYNPYQFLSSTRFFNFGNWTWFFHFSNFIFCWPNWLFTHAALVAGLCAIYSYFFF